MSDENSTDPQVEAACEDNEEAAVAHCDPGYGPVCKPDLRESSIQPLARFLGQGSHPARSPTRPYDAWRRQLEASAPLRQRAAQWAAPSDISTVVSTAELARALGRDADAGLLVSVSHDDYARCLGGVQLLIGDEQRAFNRAGWDYLHISPAVPLPMLADATPAGSFRVSLRLNGYWLGVATFSDLVGAVAGYRARGADVECIFHQLMGHVPELALDLVRASGVAHPLVWVHDFFAVCPSYALMRNDVAFCGAPTPESAACSVCSYGTERALHVARIRAFFEVACPIVLVPSAATLEFWNRRANLRHAETVVVPPARLLLATSDARGRTWGKTRPLRIAHLGARAFHKGWLVFEELALQLSDDERYVFLQLGSPGGPALPDGILNVPVRVDAEQREAMLEAVAEARVDVVVCWSFCFETFCFTAHEALAGGAFVVARADSGNVWATVEANAPAQGCAVANETALYELFRSGELRSLVTAPPRRCGALLDEGGTARWLLSRKRLTSAARLHQQTPPPSPPVAPETSAEKRIARHG